MEEQRAAGVPVRLVSGSFDPLLAIHARALQALHGQGGKIAIVLTDPPDPLLPARARAELAAALVTVDCVFLNPPAALAADFDLSTDHLQWRADFEQHVRQRNAG